MKVGVFGDAVLSADFTLVLQRVLSVVRNDVSVVFEEVVDQTPKVVVRVGGMPPADYREFGQKEVWVGLIQSHAIVTPPRGSNRVGCALCVFQHLVRNKSQVAGSRLLHPIMRSKWPGESAMRVVAEVVAEKLRCFPECTNVDQLEIVHLTKLTVEPARLIPDPHCPRCGSLPRDIPLKFKAQSRIKARDDAYRCGKGFPAKRFISYVQNRHVGLITTVYRAPDMPVALSAASMSIGNGRSELGIGRADTYDASHMVAILEILERYAGYIPRGKATVVESAYATICGEAIHPPSFGLHDHEYYADPESPVTPFDPETCYRWVWGYSFARRRPILIPEQLVYFGVPVQKERRFCVEISNGCAVGSCVEEALFYGLLEVIERDCFLLAWYSQSQLPEIDRSTLKRAETIQLLERVELVTRSKIRLFDATFDIGIPVIWALASHGTGPLVATGSAAGAHIDPEQAICSALRELGPAVVAAATRMINEEDYARLLASDNWSVKTMPDHSLLYRVPTTSSRLDFLRNTTRVRSVNDMIPEGFANRDLRDDLTELIGRVLRCGMDVLFIEQTPINFPRTLRVVKVLVPGMLPMTFGHTARRISGLPRVHEVPYRLGLTFNRHTSINLDPHPFP